jgi:uncharacterized membrane protein
MLAGAACGAQQRCPLLSTVGSRNGDRRLLTHQANSAILGSAERAGKPAALIFYLVFAILPGLDAGPLKTALLRAALFGLIACATYDLMNLATLKDWPVMVIVVDLAQGTVWASQ